jgi:hypothetical protein
MTLQKDLVPAGEKKDGRQIRARGQGENGMTAPVENAAVAAQKSGAHGPPAG